MKTKELRIVAIKVRLYGCMPIKHKVDESVVVNDRNDIISIKQDDKAVMKTVDFVTAAVKGVRGLVTAFRSLTTATEAATTAQAANNAAVAANPYGLIATAIAVVVGALVELSLHANDATEKIEELNRASDEAAQKAEEYRQEAEELSDIAEEYDELTKSAGDTAEKRERLNELQQDFIDKYGSEVEGIDLVNGAYEDQAEALFDVCERVDKSANQSERNRVIFSAGLKNVAETEREVGITAHKNVLWCEAGSIHDGFVYEQDGVIPAGWGRREEYVSISVADKDNPEDIVLYGRKEMSDKFAQTDSLVIDAGNPLDFGTVYDVGDIVTAYDAEKKVQLDSVISAATVKRSGTEYSVKLTLGESKPKLLDGYASQSDLLKKNQRDYPAAQSARGSAGAALTEYEYISDLSVKYNGLTYTAEKDSASGLISRISDSAGGEFKPKINGGITDTAFHNAVFMAVAMHSGLGAVPEKLLYTGENGAAEFSGGLTGFKDIKGSWQASGDSGTTYTKLANGCEVIAVEKAEDLSYEHDGYTDAIIVRSNEKINLTGYSKLRVVGIVFVLLFASAHECTCLRSPGGNFTADDGKLCFYYTADAEIY